MGGRGFIFHPVTDRLTFFSSIPIIDVDLFTPAMEFQLTNPASLFFPGSLLEQNKAVSSTFDLLFQRKLILCGRGDCQSSEPRSLLADFHHNWWRSESLKAIRAPTCFVQSMTQKEKKSSFITFMEQKHERMSSTLFQTSANQYSNCTFHGKAVGNQKYSQRNLHYALHLHLCFYVCEQI